MKSSTTTWPIQKQKFYNEVLGISVDSGTRPYSQDVMDNCDSSISMRRGGTPKVQQRFLGGSEIFAGIDWGTGENTYTVLSLGTYIDGRFTIFYIHRFEAEMEPPVRWN